MYNLFLQVHLATLSIKSFDWKFATGSSLKKYRTKLQNAMK